MFLKVKSLNQKRRHRKIQCRQYFTHREEVEGEIQERIMKFMLSKFQGAGGGENELVNARRSQSSLSTFFIWLFTTSTLVNEA